MEFFKIVKASTTEQVLKDKLSNQNLEKFCESIFFMDGGADICKTGGMLDIFYSWRFLVIVLWSR